MRVPHELLRSTVVIRDFVGSGARGPVYGEPRQVRCSAQPTSGVAVDQLKANGNGGLTLTVDTLVIIRPEDGPVRPESLATIGGRGYRVVQAYPVPDERRPSHWELKLAQYAGAAASAGSGS